MSEQAVIDSDASDKTKAVLTIEYTSSTGKIRRCILDTSVLVTLAAGNSNIPDTFTIAFKEWDVCVDGSQKKAVFVSSEPYNPP